MKKILILILLVLVLAPFVNSAVELNKDTYKPGESVMAKLSFTYPPNQISTEHINIYDINGKRMLIPYFIVRFSDALYYVYFTVPTAFKNDNYTLSIGPYYYALNNVLQMNTDTKLIKINEDRNTVLAFDPAAAVIDLSKQDYFYINLKNNGDNSIQLKLRLAPNGTLNYGSYNIQSKDSLKLKGTIDGIGEKTLQIVYEDSEILIPILVIGKKEVTATQTESNIPQITKTSNSVKIIDPADRINISILQDQIISGSFKIKSFWISDLKNIKLTLTGDLSDILELDQSIFDTFGSNDIKEVYMTVNKNKNINKNYEGSIIISGDGISSFYPVYVYYKAGAVQQIEPEPKETVTEQQEQVKQTELKTGVFFSILAIILVVIMVIIIYTRSKKYKPKDFI